MGFKVKGTDIKTTLYPNINLATMKDSENYTPVGYAINNNDICYTKYLDKLGGWIKSKKISEYKINGQPILTVEPGTLPTFGSNWADAEVNSPFNTNNTCFVYRWFQDGEDSDLQLEISRTKTSINMNNFSFGPAATNKVEQIFPDKVLPTRLLIFIHGAGGGGGGGNNTESNDYGGGGGGSGSWWLGVVRFDPDDRIRISLGKGGAGGSREGDGKKGNETSITHNKTVLVKLSGGNGGIYGRDGGDGGDGGTVNCVNSPDTAGLYWTIASGSGTKGGNHGENGEGIASKIFSCVLNNPTPVGSVEDNTVHDRIKSHSRAGGKKSNGGGGGASLFASGANGGKDKSKGDNGVRGAGGGGGGQGYVIGKSGAGGKGGDALVFIW